MNGPPTDDEAISAANRAFYDAFEAGDLGAMEQVWERSPRAVCTHPGWGTLRSWEAIRPSFELLFKRDDTLQFIVTSEEISLEGGVAWVTCDENLWSREFAGTAAALNVFVRDELTGSWRMVAHHASAVHSMQDEDGDR